MTTFTEDKLFKNINDKDARILLEIINVHTAKVKIWTKELRLLDPKDYLPDIILELDFENLIIELQSTKVNDDFSKRALTYVAIANRNKENDKEVNLIVLSTAEESKTIKYQYNKDNIFTYQVINLNELNEEEIIPTVEEKIKNKLKINENELILYSLVPMIVKKDREKYIKRVVHNLLQVKNITNSIKSLAYGIEWLIVDKFMKNEEDRNILCDTLGDRMSLIYEYGKRKEEKGIKKGINEGIKEICNNLIKSGMTINEISQKTGKPIQELTKLLYQ